MTDSNRDDEVGARIFARSLVHAARRDLPTQDAYQRTLTALGSGAVIGGAALLASTATTPKAGGLLASLAGLVKWGAAGVAIGALGLGAVHYAGEKRLREGERSSAAPAKPSVAPRQSETVTADRPRARDLPVSPAPPASAPSHIAPAPDRSPDRHSEPPSDAPTADDLAAEAEVLGWARAELGANAPAQALLILEGYRTTWPNGRLGLEARVLQIEALVLSGRKSEALVLADGFLAVHAGTPFARRVRNLVGKDRANDASSR